MDALGLELAIKLVNESFERGTLELEPEFANGLGEYLLEFRSGFLEIAHWGYSEFYTTEAGLAREGVSLMQTALAAQLRAGCDVAVADDAAACSDRLKAGGVGIQAAEEGESSDRMSRVSRTCLGAP